MTMSFFIVARIRTCHFIIHFRVCPATQEVPQTKSSNSGHKDPDIEGHYDQHQDIATGHLYEVQQGLQAVLPALNGPPATKHTHIIHITANACNIYTDRYNYRVCEAVM